MHVLTAYTSEIDDPDLAVAEIKQQLNLEENPSANALGILSCHYEFVYSGVAKAICDSLPFDIVGATTTALGIRGDVGTLLFSLMVLTGDDVTFKTALTEPLKGDPAGKISSAYAKAADGFDERPALVFAYAPFMIENSGDEYVSVITKVSGGSPCFGTLAVDDTADFHECFMVMNGEHYRERMAMALVYGNVAPKFFLATISQAKVLDKPALVTSSEGHILKEVNGRPLVEYFEDLGLTKASETSYAMTSLPFMLDYGDGTPPVSKVFIGLNEEKHGICAGVMPEGSTLYIGVFDKEDVLLTSKDAVADARAAAEGASGMLMYSCVSRNMSLGGDQFAELNMVREEIGAKLPFMMSYSGGEICPTQLKSHAINRFHNNTFILCVL